MRHCNVPVGWLILLAFLLLLVAIPKDGINRHAAKVLCQPSRSAFRRRFLAAGCQSWNSYLLHQPGTAILKATHKPTPQPVPNPSTQVPTLGPSSTPGSQSTQQTPATPPSSSPQNPIPSPHTDPSHTHTTRTPSYPTPTPTPSGPNPTATPATTPFPGPQSADGPEVATRRGIFFSLGGRRFIPVGTNWFDAHVLHKYSEADVVATLKLHASKGVNIIRVFAHLNGGCVPLAAKNSKVCSPIQPVAGVYNEDALRRMDFLLDAAASFNIRVIMSLVNFWNEYHDGGMKWYVKNVRSAQDGQDMEFFFSDPNVRQLYRKYIATLVTRVNTYNQRLYGMDGTVFAWELANEPHTSPNYELNKGLEPGSLLLRWASEMSSYIKHDLKAAQMVCTGGEGYRSDGPQVDWYSWMDTGVKGMNFTGNIMLDTIDFATVHAYFMQWGFVPKGDVYNSNGDPYKLQLGYAWGIKRFLQDRAALAHAINKPILLEEFGVTEDISGWTRVYNYKPTRSQYLKCIVTGALEANLAGFLYWEITANKDDGQYLITYSSDGADVLQLLFAQRWDDIMSGVDCTCVGTRLARSPACSACGCSDLPHVVSTSASDPRNQPCSETKLNYACETPLIQSGGYCAATCGRCTGQDGCPSPPPPPPAPRPIPADCIDDGPVGGFTCHQQAVEWKKCCEPWMKNRCNRSCERCTGASEEEQQKRCGGVGG